MMNKKERFQAVRERRQPDFMPVWPRVMSQMIFSHGLLLPEVTGTDWYDAEKITGAVLANITYNGYDIAIPTYIDHAFGVPPLGGEITIPEKFGIAAGPTDNKPVRTKADWPRVKKLLASFDIRRTDPRMAGALAVIENVSAEIGKDIPLVTSAYVGSVAAMHMFRPNEAILEDMYEDPEWVDEMCKVATDWSMDWIRAQYAAGANSVTFLAEVMGTLMVNPSMAQRFNLENIARVVEMVRKEFGQGTWLHTHGDMTNPKAYAYLTALATQAGVEGFHFDEMNPTGWIMEHVVGKFNVSACIITDGHLIVHGPTEKIRQEVKHQISQIGEGLGIMMAPSCQLLPATPNEHFKAWVDATHEFGRYPLGS
jgi:uroporphyrinogen-III decarboxylase